MRTSLIGTLVDPYLVRK